MSAKLHIQRKSYYLCNNILRRKCKFILANGMYEVLIVEENGRTFPCVVPCNGV